MSLHQGNSMPRTHARAKGLKPKKCVICKKIFQPFTCRQQQCGDPKCAKEYLNLKARQQYYKAKKEKKKIKRVLSEDIVRKFYVFFFINPDGTWYWEATGDNGCKLTNGNFNSLREARKDYQEAINGGEEDAI